MYWPPIVRSTELSGQADLDVSFAIWHTVVPDRICPICIFIILLFLLRGPGRSVGIATGYGDGWSGDRIPVWRDFPPIQTGPGVHPISCTMGTGSFPGVKYGRDVLLTTHPLLVPLSWKSRAMPLPTLWATTGPVTGTLYLYLYLYFSC